MKERLSGDMWRPLTSLLSPLTFEFPFSRRPRKGGSVTANDEGRAGLETADREDGEESRRGSPLHLVFHRRKRNSSSRKPARFCFDESERAGLDSVEASTPAHIHLSFCNPPTAFTNRSRGTFSNTMRSNSLHSEWLIYIHPCSWYLQ
ncbi:uncharacterized protein LOC106389946 [Brassica napus]|uniref:Uncharacterized protein n=2 Tax=Brassica TaxID=3705 RepID=A0A8X7U888_BRACI|nr:uncharacterized protein LOC106389946 [Brassica napus]KAG2268934.1 hypothetical protein Bca52824_063489 [Brassica carinata]CAF1927384.1 unnamed protein product [Brassica napus]